MPSEEFDTATVQIGGREVGAFAELSKYGSNRMFENRYYL
jgi:hypothetical protein